jgi:hypothetical protein
MAAYVELYVDQGASFGSTLEIYDDANNVTVNVANYTISGALKRSYYSQNTSANLTCTIINAANGVIGISLTAGQTANIRAGRYLFDVKTTSPDMVTTRVIEGIITITPGIT